MSKVNPELLKQLYIDKKYSLSKISRTTGHTLNTIKKYLMLQNIYIFNRDGHKKTFKRSHHKSKVNNNYILNINKENKEREVKTPDNNPPRPSIPINNNIYLNKEYINRENKILNKEDKRNIEYEEINMKDKRGVKLYSNIANATATKERNIEKKTAVQGIVSSIERTIPKYLKILNKQENIKKANIKEAGTIIGILSDKLIRFRDNGIPDNKFNNLIINMFGNSDKLLSEIKTMQESRKVIDVDTQGG